MRPAFHPRLEQAEHILFKVILDMVVYGPHVFYNRMDDIVKEWQLWELPSPDSTSTALADRNTELDADQLILLRAIQAVQRNASHEKTAKVWDPINLIRCDVDSLQRWILRVVNERRGHEASTSITTSAASTLQVPDVRVAPRDEVSADESCGTSAAPSQPIDPSAPPDTQAAPSQPTDPSPPPDTQAALSQSTDSPPAADTNVGKDDVGALLFPSASLPPTDELGQANANQDYDSNATGDDVVDGGAEVGEDEQMDEDGKTDGEETDDEETDGEEMGDEETGDEETGDEGMQAPPTIEDTKSQRDRISAVHAPTGRSVHDSVMVSTGRRKRGAEADPSIADNLTPRHAKRVKTSRVSSYTPKAAAPAKASSSRLVTVKIAGPKSQPSGSKSSKTIEDEPHAGERKDEVPSDAIIGHGDTRNNPIDVDRPVMEVYHKPSAFAVKPDGSRIAGTLPLTEKFKCEVLTFHPNPPNTYWSLDEVEVPWWHSTVRTTHYYLTAT